MNSDQADGIILHFETRARITVERSRQNSNTSGRRESAVVLAQIVGGRVREAGNVQSNLKEVD
jgi:hypothetical protein